MRSVDINKILGSGLTYCGVVESARQTYYVFEAVDFFFVLSFSASKPMSGNFNLVNKQAVKYVKKKFSGQNVTSNDVVSGSKRTKHAPSSMDALNILYVLVSLDEAEIESIGERNQLFFDVY